MDLEHTPQRVAQVALVGLEVLAAAVSANRSHKARPVQSPNQVSIRECQCELKANKCII